MIDEKMVLALNGQIGAEFESSYLYLSMSAHFQAQSLSGFASWFRIQAQEELMHTVKLFDFLENRGGRIELEAIPAPPTHWESPLEVFAAVLTHERLISSHINELVELCFELRDHATRSFLQWFLDEQVEEEGMVEDIIAKLKLVGNDGQGLFMIDQELAKRVFVTPA